MGPVLALWDARGAVRGSLGGCPFGLVVGQRVDRVGGLFWLGGSLLMLGRLFAVGGRRGRRSAAHDIGRTFVPGFVAATAVGEVASVLGQEINLDLWTAVVAALESAGSADSAVLDALQSALDSNLLEQREPHSADGVAHADEATTGTVAGSAQPALHRPDRGEQEVGSDPGVQRHLERRGGLVDPGR